jgi:hypothetical protein
MDIHDVIQEFVDGEPVDPVALERALADPEGRAHLIDLVVLRKLVRRSHVAVPVAVAHGTGVPVSPTPPRRLRMVAAAAVVAVVASAGGYFFGERATTTTTQPPADVVSAVPASSAPTVSPDPATPAPAPTVVIRFQPGVDWTESGGF